MRKKKVLAVFVSALFVIFFYSFAFAAPYGGATPDPDVMKAANNALDDAEKALPGGYFKMSGRYRMAAGVNSNDFIVNGANANQNLNNLQGPNFRYIFGSQLNNTYDPAIYSQYLLNVDFSPRDKVSFYTQIVNDPWSWVGTTGEQVQRTDVDDTSILRYNLKYFGSMDATIGEVYRANDADRFNFPEIKVQNGQLKPTRITGMLPGVLVPANHTIVSIPRLNIDYEYRPIRKLWMDYQEDQWHARLFALADETQALTTDDPLELSNHKDY